MGNSMPWPAGQALGKCVRKGSVVKGSFLSSNEDIGAA